MRIKDLLDPKSIELQAQVNNHEEAIERLVDLMAASGNIGDKELYKTGVYNREKEANTAVGDGVAIPHCRSSAVTKAGIAAITIDQGVNYNAPDGEAVSLLFLIAAPETKDNVHVEVLSKLSTLLLDDSFTYKLRQASSVEEFISIVDATESEVDAKGVNKPVSFTTKLVAVTACPTGIAHTYMAAEKLEKTAQRMGCSIKVETRGASGVKNALSPQNIAEADCVIVAADTQVPMAQFDGKKVIECKVSDGINKADSIIAAAKAGKAAVYHTQTATANTTDFGNESSARRIYKHLMSGVSYMLPFVVGGGILIAIAFLIDGFMFDLNNLPVEKRSSFGSLSPYSALFMKIGGGAFGFMLPVLAGFIAFSIADRPGLAVGFIGGMLAAQGKSGFIGALIAGFAAGYLILLLKKIFANLPKNMDGLKPILLYPLLGSFGIGLFMLFAVEPPIGSINTAMNSALASMSGTQGILLGLILGGMMAVDMGGPVNKAAYVFGTASIVAGNYAIMAAVMIGGMVPPIAIAISTILFHSKYTAEERKTGPANFVMGFSFITEGAIPFAASDPLRVIPSCIVGSAIAGAISMAAHCTLMAPHGGIFVFPVVGNAFMYLLALLIGSFVSAVLLGILKKPVSE